MVEPEFIKLNNEGNSNKFYRGWVVWAKLKKNHQFWPGMLLNHDDCDRDHPGPNHRWLYWFGDHRISKVEIINICDFDDYFDNIFNVNGSQTYKIGVEAARAVLIGRSDFKGFENKEDYQTENERCIEEEMCIKGERCIEELPPAVVKDLHDIRNRNKEENEIKEELDKNVEEDEKLMNNSFTESCVLDNKSDLFWSDSDSESSLSVETSHRNRVSLKENKVKINEICICCQEVCKELRQQNGHPLFEGLCCAECFKQVKKCMFDYGEDNIHIFCSICATAGEMFICDEKKCCRVFCYECIEQFWNKKKVSEIRLQDPWHCFLCTGDTLSDYLKIKADWEVNVMNLFQTTTNPWTEILMPQKQKLRVLSLNDGIGAVLVALEELGLDIGNYFAIEDDVKSVHVSLVNHGAKAYYKHLGKFKNFDFKWFVAKWGQVDLLVGGSYNDLSLRKEREYVNQNVEYTRLCYPFFEFFRVWTQAKHINDGNSLLWLYASDVNLTSTSRDLFSRFLECKPLILNARKYSAFCHPRLVWTNIPVLGSNWISSNSKITSGFMSRGQLHKTIVKDARWITNIEKSFGFHKMYTNIGDVNVLQRQKLLGRSGNVHFLEKMLQPFCKLFATMDKPRCSKK